MEKDLISVVVPIYNVSPYICRCLDSIAGQTYKNLQIILVDDGSTDDSGEIADIYAEKDSRITVIHKKNGGLSDARNTGIDAAVGEYIVFIDSDDYIEIDFIFYLHSLIISQSAEIAACEFSIINEKKEEIKHNKIFDENKTFEKDEYKLLFSLYLSAELSTLFDSAWNKIYKRSLFEKLRFPFGKLYEETRTIPKIIYESEKITFGTIPKYYYCVRQNSILTSSFSEKSLDFITATKEATAFIGEFFPDLDEYCKRRELYAKLRVFRQMCESKNTLKTDRENLRKEILGDSQIKGITALTPKRDKIAIAALRFGTPVFSLCWKIYCKITKRK